MDTHFRWEGGGGVTRGETERKQRGRETEMTGGIWMHLWSRVNPLVCLFSFHLGHCAQKKRSPVCVCVRVLVDVCILAGWMVFAWLHKRWRKLVHARIVSFFLLSFFLVVWPVRRCRAPPQGPLGFRKDYPASSLVRSWFLNIKIHILSLSRFLSSH